MRIVLTALLLLVALDLRAQTARELVTRALDAMGGEARLRAIRSVELKSIAQRPAIEQSERPEGPYSLSYFQTVEVRDYEKQRLRIESSSRGQSNWWESAEWTKPVLTIVEDGVAVSLRDPQKPVATFHSQVFAARETLAYSPERVLLNALAATDLTREPDAPYHGYPQHVVRFTRDGATVRLRINPRHYYPSAVELTRARPYEMFWYVWGDVTTVIDWGTWTLEPNGIHYPRTLTITTKGLPERIISTHEIRWNPELPEGTWPDLTAVKQNAPKPVNVDAFAFGRANEPPIAVTPDILTIPGGWYVAAVRQGNSIVMIEGVVSNGYSARAIEEAEKHWPGAKVTAVVTTSFMWPHVGGMREYFARGMDVYALDLNGGILREIAAAPHKTFPDELQRKPRAPKLKLVANRLTIGSGPARMELIPIRAVTAERMMAIWFPEQQLLYTSDAFTRFSDGKWWTPQYISEFAGFIEREKLAPKTIFGMHYSPMPYEDFAKAVSAH